MTYRIESLKLDEGKLHVARQIPEVKNYNGDMERPPDIGRTELLVNGDTRVWKGDQQAKLTDLAVGDALLVNLTGERPAILRIAPTCGSAPTRTNSSANSKPRNIRPQRRSSL